MAAHAQPPDTIACKKMFLSLLYRYRKADGARFKRGEFKFLLLSQPESKKYYLKYRKELRVGYFLALGGIAIQNYGMKPSIEGCYIRKVNPYPFIATAVLCGSLYFIINSGHQRHRAVKAYNRVHQKTML